MRESLTGSLSFSPHGISRLHVGGKIERIDRKRSLVAVHKLISEAQRNGIIGSEGAANIAGVPNLSQKGARLGNWLTREQAKELLTVPNRSTLKGS